MEYICAGAYSLPQCHFPLLFIPTLSMAQLKCMISVNKLCWKGLLPSVFLHVRSEGG